MRTDAARSFNLSQDQQWAIRDADVVLLAAPFGFGPLSKALSLAEILQSLGHTVTILSDAAGAAIASSLGFAAAEYHYRERLDLTTFRGRAVVSCLDISTPISRGATPLVVVDSLYWLRGIWERDYTGQADIYIAQRFAERTSPPPAGAIHVEWVDAILGPAFVNQVADVAERRGAVIYPGGLGSPYLDNSYRLDYVEWILAGFLEAASVAGFDLNSSTLIVPNTSISTPSMTTFARNGGSIVSDFALLPGFLRRARHALIAPGIEISLEAAAFGLHPFYLPAFNGSHVAQVPTLVQLEFGRLAAPTHFSILQSRVMPEGNLRATTAAVQSLNLQCLSEAWVFEEFYTTIVAALGGQPEPLRPRYPLGWNGAQQAAALIQRVLL